MHSRPSHHGLGILNWLAAGMTEQQNIGDYPELEPEDFRAAYEYAARVGRRVASRLTPIA